MARLTTQGLTGHQIGKWSVFESFLHPTRRERLYRCVCACGTEKTVKHTHLADGKTSSCGCSWTTHGMSRSNEYRVWDSMIRRCHSPSHHAFKDYGARGITVCDKWKNFEGFIEDMGFQPEGLSIERINNDLGYSKENCRWATVTEQARNRRATKLDEDKVMQIKILLKTGVSQNKIASQFSVSRSNIGHIAQGTTWRQL
jgi:predicted XRE-type DNA-binding protein